MNRSIYLERYGYGSEIFASPPDPCLKLVVVIPCYFEPDLTATLESLGSCPFPPGKAEVIVVINQSDTESGEISRANLSTLAAVEKWIAKKSAALSILITNQTLPHKFAGVGLARKIGMDEAVRRFNRLGRDGIIACLDADCLVSPDYLQAIYSHFKDHPGTPGCSIYFEHELEGALSSDHYRAIASYELHLRYYTHGLKYSGLPCAFQTVGSSMAVRSSAYQKQGGMNKRKAGEDFYFLQKIIKLGGFTELKSTRVIPSSRVSSRVPFGTGKAMIDRLKHSDSPVTYHLNTFRDLQKLAVASGSLFQASAAAINRTWEELPEGLQQFISKKSFYQRINDMNLQTSAPESFRKRFFHWCDGFLAFKYANYARKFLYPEMPLTEAAGILLSEFYGIQVKATEVKPLLMQYRSLDQS